MESQTVLVVPSSAATLMMSTSTWYILNNIAIPLRQRLVYSEFYIRSTHIAVALVS